MKTKQEKLIGKMGSEAGDIRCGWGGDFYFTFFLLTAVAHVIVILSLQQQQLKMVLVMLLAVLSFTLSLSLSCRLSCRDQQLEMRA